MLWSVVFRWRTALQHYRTETLSLFPGQYTLYRKQSLCSVSLFPVAKRVQDGFPNGRRFEGHCSEFFRSSVRSLYIFTQLCEWTLFRKKFRRPSEFFYFERTYFRTDILPNRARLLPTEEPLYIGYCVAFATRPTVALCAIATVSSGYSV